MGVGTVAVGAKQATDPEHMIAVSAPLLPLPLALDPYSGLTHERQPHRVVVSMQLQSQNGISTFGGRRLRWALTESLGGDLAPADSG